MSLKLRITLLSLIWLAVILILLNVFIYYFVLKTTTESEIQLLWNKADTILQKEEVHHPANWVNSDLLTEFFVSQEMIRIIDTKGEVANQIVTDDELLKKEPSYQSKPKSIIFKDADERMVYIEQPILQNGKPVGLLEIGRLLEGLDDYLNTLTTVLLFSSLGALTLAVVVGYFYIDLLLKPINQLIRTMRVIQNSGTFQKINISHQAKEDELVKLGRTFNEMVSQLEENFNRQQQFLEDASHELRTPLTVIQSYTNLLKRWGSSDSDIREEAIEAIDSEANRLKRMTDELMRAVSVGQGTEIVKEPIDLVPLITSVVKALKQAFHREITIDAPAMIEMRADREKIKQLCIILLDNGMKYSKEPIVVRLQDKEETVVLEVIDRGMGIDEKDLPHIFDRFYRVDKARARESGGSGLGLAIAKKIVVMHEGFIEVESQVGEGTQVIVTLPKDVPQAEE